MLCSSVPHVDSASSLRTSSFSCIIWCAPNMHLQFALPHAHTYGNSIFQTGLYEEKSLAAALCVSTKTKDVPGKGNLQDMRFVSHGLFWGRK